MLITCSLPLYVGQHILHLHIASCCSMCYYTATYHISTWVGCSVINAENTMKYRYRLGPFPNLCDTNLSNSLEQISNHKRCSTIRRSKVSGDFSAKLEAESPVLHRTVGFHLQQNTRTCAWLHVWSCSRVRSSVPVDVIPPFITNELQLGSVQEGNVGDVYHFTDYSLRNIRNKNI